MKKFLAVVVAAFVLLVGAVPAIAAPATDYPKAPLAFALGIDEYFVNDQMPGIQMDGTPYMSAGNHVMVPADVLENVLGATNLGSGYVQLKQVADSLGYDMAWEGTSQTVELWPKVWDNYVTMSGGSAPPLTLQSFIANDDNVIQHAAITQARSAGFGISYNTHLKIDAGTGMPEYTSLGNFQQMEPLGFDIDTTRGDTQGQVADTKNILSCISYLDPATVTTIMNDINADLPVVAANQACATPQGEQNPPFCSVFINSPAGGCIELSAMPSGYGSKASLWIGFIVWNQHLNLS
jgi:hypothetical protein